MTQPSYVPIATGDRVRPVERLPVPRSWRADRPSDQVNAVVPTGALFGHTGPDLGYGLKLARRFLDRLQLAEGETASDAVAGCFGVGCRRAGVFGRAPVIYDLQHAFTVWGFLGGDSGVALADLVDFRAPLFRGAAHDYWLQRDIADLVIDSALLLSPAQVRERLGDWRSLIRA